MLTKDDLKQIQTLVSESLADFFNNDLAPYLSKKFSGIDNELKENKLDHDEMLRRLDKNDLEHERMKEQLDKIELKVGGHEIALKKIKKSSKKINN